MWELRPTLSVETILETGGGIAGENGGTRDSPTTAIITFLLMASTVMTLRDTQESTCSVFRMTFTQNGGFAGTNGGTEQSPADAKHRLPIQVIVLNERSLQGNMCV